MSRPNHVYVIEMLPKGTKFHWFPEPFTEHFSTLADANEGVAKRRSSMEGRHYEYRAVKYLATVSKEPK